MVQRIPDRGAADSEALTQFVCPKSLPRAQLSSLNEIPDQRSGSVGR